MEFHDEIDVAVIIKAAPEIGKKHGETVCVAGIDEYGKWHRLYPVPFKDLRPEQKFSRWDVVSVRWRLPGSDYRVESKRIDAVNLRVKSKVRDRDKPSLVERALVTNLEDEQAAGRSLALIRPANPRFIVTPLSKSELGKSQRRRDELHAQGDLFSSAGVSKEAPPFGFYYQFEHGGKTRKHVCIDWETEATFFKWRKLYGEADCLSKMKIKWGEEIPSSGIVFAMGTHRVPHWKSWLLSGVIQVKDLGQNQFQL